MTGPRYLLDTNICIYIRRRRPQEVLRRFQELRPGDAAISVITYGELMYGAHRHRERTRALAQIAELTALLPVLGLPAGAGDAYGELRADLEAAGRMIGNNDLWIAAHAIAADLTLVTNNEREFRRLEGLKLQNWVGRSTD